MIKFQLFKIQPIMVDNCKTSINCTQNRDAALMFLCVIALDLSSGQIQFLADV